MLRSIIWFTFFVLAVNFYGYELQCAAPAGAPLAPAAAPTAAPEQTTMPDIPGLDPQHGAMEIVVTKANENRELEKSYIQKENVKSGSVKGFCFVVYKEKLPAPMALDMAKLIQKPEPREAEFYTQFKYTEPQWIAPYPVDGRYPVLRAAVFTRNIKFGARAPFERPSYLVWSGKFEGNDPCSMMIKERLQIRNCDPFPCHFVITGPPPRNAVIFEEVLGPNTDVRKPGEVNAEVTAFNKHTEYFSSQVGFARTGKLVLSPPLKEPGIYTLSCKRRTWMRSTLLVLENPFAALSSSGHGGWGKFTIEQMPVGRHTLEVWHPVLEPVLKAIEVEIKENETTQLNIEFKAPPQE